MKKNKIGYLLIIPALIVLVVVVMYPTVYTIRLSFSEWKLVRSPAPTAFVGLENYERMIRDAEPRHSFAITGLFVGATVGLEVLIGLLMALLLARETKIHRFARRILILPFVLSPALVGISWRFFLNPDFGIFDYLLRFFLPVDERFIWLGNKTWAMIAIISCDMWQWTPFIILILSAGLSSIPREVYDAAQVDGAGKWQIFHFITFPFLIPTLVVALIIKTIYSVKVFDPVVTMTRGGPGAATDLLSYYVYKVAFMFFHMGDAAAISFFLAMILTILVTFYVRLLPKGSTA